MRFTTRTRWAVLTFGPAVAAFAFAVESFLEGDVSSGLMLLGCAGAFVGLGEATLSGYRAGYWRGRFEEARWRRQVEETGPYLDTALLQPPSPWDLHKSGPPPDL